MSIIDDIASSSNELSADEALANVLENETPEEPQPETNETETDPSQEGETEEAKETEEVSEVESENTPEVERVPYSRFKKVKDDADALKSQVEALEQFKTQFEQNAQTSASVTLPPEFQAIYGNDDAAVAEYHRQQRVLEERDSLLLQKFEQKRADDVKKQKDLEDSMVEDINSRLAGLREKGLKFKKNELLEVVNEYTPKDKNGNFLGEFIDFEKAHEILELRKSSVTPSKKSIARKDVAAAASTGTPSTNDGAPQQISWHSV